MNHHEAEQDDVLADAIPALEEAVGTADVAAGALENVAQELRDVEGHHELAELAEMLEQAAYKLLDASDGADMVLVAIKGLIRAHNKEIIGE